ncbi:MAG: hypothetical protein ACLSAF_12155 [Intestinimonas sp.]
MESRALSRAMVESVVDRSLREIVSDPDRSLRKLVDLGNLLARGRSQKESFSLLSRVLENEGSPYYDMVRRIVQEVDREKLKCFGINLGWESWTVGAGRIRALEGERHYNIPWCLTFRLGGQPWALGAEDYRALLLQGQELGICSYFFSRKSPAPTLGFSRSWPSSSAAALFFLFLPRRPSRSLSSRRPPGAAI